MVTQDRGQLLLLGGLAFAIVLLVAIPLTNSLVVTESAASSETVSTIDRVGNEEAAINRSMESLVASVDTEKELRWALQNYSATNTRVRGASNGVYVNTTLNETIVKGAERRQTDGSDFDDPGTGGSTNWQVVDDADPIANFNLSLEAASPAAPPAGSPFTVRIIGDSGGEWRLRAYDPTPPGGPLRVETKAGAGSWVTDCSGPAVIEVDIKQGTCTVGGSTVPLTSTYSGTLDKPYRVEVENGNRAEGDYLFTARGDFSATGGEDPYPVIPAIDISYVGPDTSYNRTIIAEEGL